MMNNEQLIEFGDIPKEAQSATKVFADIVFNRIWPLVICIRKKLEKAHKSDGDGMKTLRNVFMLSCSQIKKCVLTLFEVFKVEHQKQALLQDTRQCTTDRLTWCVNRLKTVDQILDELNDSTSSNKVEPDSSFLTAPMYFVNWIDHAFEILAKLSNVVYETDYKESDAVYEAWKDDIIDIVSELHISLDELLLSTMTLCKYCLPSDQHIVKARCQVVLRETKVLLSELITGDLNTAIKVTKESMKLPVMPSNVNVLIDVLKDVLYALETNTNTALLALLVHCFSNSVSQVDLLKEHFTKGPKGSCPCVEKDGDAVEDCLLVKDFDTYNERLMQIGTFAVSCSSDQNRILSLRSGLASLEALDPHLVPALVLWPGGPHAGLLALAWTQEVREIRDSVFLIVDPAAFAEKSKQMMHQKLLRLMETNRYDNAAVRAVVDIGCMVEEFFEVYQEHEPDALVGFERMAPLLTDLRKVQVECKIVSNLLCSDKDVRYDVTIRTNKGANFDQLLKRLKLLYTIVNRINSIFHPRDNDDQLFVNEICEEEPPMRLKNVTHTILGHGNTYVNSPRKAANISRSIFARTGNARSASNFVSKLPKQLKVKRSEQLSFSLQLDILLDDSSKDGSGDAEGHAPRQPVNKHLIQAREQSILYKYSPKKDRNSLRKSVLSKNYAVFVEPTKLAADTFAESEEQDNGALMDDNTSLQITEILDQMADISNLLTTKHAVNSTRPIAMQKRDQTPRNNVLTLNINNQSATISKRIWEIPVNGSTVEMCLDDTICTNTPNVSNSSSQPSNVSTLERLNDLDLLESRLSNLKSLQQETTL